LSCPEKRGVGFFDRPVHFADITGNGHRGRWNMIVKEASRGG
jgi:hypothetical protein